MEHEHTHDHVHPPKSRKWLKRAMLGNLGLGIVQVSMGVVSGANTLVAEGVHNAVDSAGYALNHSAAAHEANGVHERARRINRRAGALICIGAGVVAAQSLVELGSGGTAPQVTQADAVAMFAGTGLNGAVTAGLNSDAHDGGAHHMGWLHAASDIAGSVINSVGMFFAIRGVPYADQLAATASSVLYIAMNYPTESRISHHH
jgi:Co/Zn/Cd efflux system component